MTTPAAGMTGRAAGRAPRGALLGWLLAAAVILGLLLMHAVNLYGMSPATTSAPTGHGVHVAAQASTGQQHLDLAAAQVDCQACDQSSPHGSLAGGCAVALLIVVLLLARPAGWWHPGARLTRARPRGTLQMSRRPQPPSLHTLGIMRT